MNISILLENSTYLFFFFKWFVFYIKFNLKIKLLIVVIQYRPIYIIIDGHSLKHFLVMVRVSKLNDILFVQYGTNNVPTVHYCYCKIIFIMQLRLLNSLNCTVGIVNSRVLNSLMVDMEIKLDTKKCELVSLVAICFLETFISKSIKSIHYARNYRE